MNRAPTKSSAHRRTLEGRQAGEARWRMDCWSRNRRNTGPTHSFTGQGSQTNSSLFQLRGAAASGMGPRPSSLALRLARWLLATLGVTDSVACNCEPRRARGRQIIQPQPRAGAVLLCACYCYHTTCAATGNLGTDTACQALTFRTDKPASLPACLYSLLPRRSAAKGSVCHLLQL